MARVKEMEALFEAKLDKATVDRAWVLYRNVMNEVNRLYFESREGAYDEFGVAIDAQHQAGSRTAALRKQSMKSPTPEAS